MTEAHAQFFAEFDALCGACQPVAVVPQDQAERTAIAAGWTQAPAHVKRPGTWWREARPEENDKRPPIMETAEQACAYDRLV